jgi:Zn-dependent M28 family amino/carboxypeptidase
MLRRLLFICATLLMAGAIVWAQSGATVPRAPRSSPLALSNISDRSLRSDLQFLASDLLEGRAPSTRGGELAATYIATRFAALGLLPGGENGSYFQPVTILEAKLDPPVTVAVSGGTGAPETLTHVTDVVAFSGTEQSEVTVDADVVFVGFGINAPEQHWNDYAGADVRGKVVLMMVNDPPAPATEPTLFGGPALTYYGRWTYKFEEAARQGAAGAMLIHTTESASYPWQVVQTAWTGTQYRLPLAPGQPALPLKSWVTEDVARRIVKRAGKDLDQLRAAASVRGFTAVPLGVRLSAQLHQSIARKTSPNVIGYVKGTNPSQAVLYTAHYDHFGIRDPKPGEPPDADRIYNGAVDNASGVAGILAIASAFTHASAKPPRSVYFVSTTAEESGLLGSEYLAAHPPLPIDQIAANINVDSLNVLGPTRDVVLLGAERSTLGTLARPLIEAQGRQPGVDASPGAGYFFRSDHFPLAKAGVPAISLSEPEEFVGRDAAFAKKAHDDYTNHRYHQPSDEYDPHWDLSGALADLTLLAELGWRVAASTMIPSYVPTEQFAQPRLHKAAK